MMIERCYTVDGDTKNLIEEDWDILIILDACRYDFFKDVYRNYLDGDVKKALSPAIHTMDWLNKVFPDFYDDVVYISANPYINSRIEVTDPSGNKFSGKNHFLKVINVWKWGWDKNMGTVHPSNVNKALFKAKDNHKNKRFILHYIQPHAPYISENYAHYIPSIKSVEATWINKERNIIESINIRSLGRKVIQKTLGLDITWKIGKLLNLSIDSQVGAIGYKEGMKGLRNAYKENLEVVLESVVELLEHVSGNILITADHGEYLGESGRYGHGIVPRRPPIVEVPWLTISRGESEEKVVGERVLLKDRIKMLKRMGNL